MNARTLGPGPNALSPDARFWDRIAVKYSKQPVKDPNAFERKIAITRALIRPSDRLLDVGCGTGSLALRLAPFADHVCGLDFSPEMIRIAREKAVTLATPNVSFEVGTVDHIHSEPDGFDGVTAYSLLHLVPNRKRTIEQIHRLLKPGGYFVSSTICLAGSWFPYGGLLAAMRFFGQAPHTVAVLSAKALVDEIQSAGFIDVQCPDVGAEEPVSFVLARKGAS